MKYLHHIFDIDGTMLDTEQTGVQSLQIAAKELFGADLDYPAAYKAFGMPSSEVAAAYGFSDAERFAEVWEIHFQELMGLVKPFPGVEETLRGIKAAGGHLGIVTSRSSFEFSYDPYLKAWRDLFDVVICAEDAPRHKPFPDPALAYMDRAGARPEECIYLGDTMMDFECATSAGCTFALADWRSRGLQGIPAQQRFSSCDELKTILEL